MILQKIGERLNSFLLIQNEIQKQEKGEINISNHSSVKGCVWL